PRARGAPRAAGSSPARRQPGGSGCRPGGLRHAGPDLSGRRAPDAVGAVAVEGDGQRLSRPPALRLVAMVAGAPRPGRGRGAQGPGPGSRAGRPRRGDPGADRPDLPPAAGAAAGGRGPALRGWLLHRGSGRDPRGDDGQRQAALVSGRPAVTGWPGRAHMSCVPDRVLWLIQDGEDRPLEQAHVRACLGCAARYERLARDLDVLGHALRTLPAGRPVRRPVPAVGWGGVAVAATLVVLIALAGWAGRRAQPLPGGASRRCARA